MLMIDRLSPASFADWQGDVLRPWQDSAEIDSPRLGG
jgi:hypothetical protein